MVVFLWRSSLLPVISSSKSSLALSLSLSLSLSQSDWHESNYMSKAKTCDIEAIENKMFSGVLLHWLVNVQRFEADTSCYLIAASVDWELVLIRGIQWVWGLLPEDSCLRVNTWLFCFLMYILTLRKPVARNAWTSCRNWWGQWKMGTSHIFDERH